MTCLLHHLLLDEHRGVIAPALGGKQADDGGRIGQLLEDKEVEAEVIGGVDGFA